MFRHNIQTALVTGESHRAAVLSLSGNDHKLFRWLSYNTWNWYKKNSIRDNVILSEVVKCKNNIQNVRFQRHQFQVKVFGMIPFFWPLKSWRFTFRVAVLLIFSFMVIDSRDVTELGPKLKDTIVNLGSPHTPSNFLSVTYCRNTENISFRV